MLLHWKTKLKHPVFQENKTFTATGYYNMGYGRQYIDRRSDWRDVILPAMPTQAPGLQTMSYVIRALEPAQIYEAKVQSRNKFGWSPVSEAFTFQTTDTGKYCSKNVALSLSALCPCTFLTRKFLSMHSSNLFSRFGLFRKADLTFPDRPQSPRHVYDGE